MIFVALIAQNRKHTEIFVVFLLVRMIVCVLSKMPAACNQIKCENNMPNEVCLKFHFHHVCWSKQKNTSPLRKKQRWCLPMCFWLVKKCFFRSIPSFWPQIIIIVITSEFFLLYWNAWFALYTKQICIRCRNLSNLSIYLVYSMVCKIWIQIFSKHIYKCTFHFSLHFHVNFARKSLSIRLCE